MINLRTKYRRIQERQEKVSKHNYTFIKCFEAINWKLFYHFSLGCLVLFFSVLFKYKHTNCHVFVDFITNLNSLGWLDQMEQIQYNFYIVYV